MYDKCHESDTCFVTSDASFHWHGARGREASVLHARTKLPQETLYDLRQPHDSRVKNNNLKNLGLTQAMPQPYVLSLQCTKSMECNIEYLACDTFFFKRGYQPRFVGRLPSSMQVRSDLGKFGTISIIPSPYQHAAAHAVVKRTVGKTVFHQRESQNAMVILEEKSEMAHSDSAASHSSETASTIRETAHDSALHHQINHIPHKPQRLKRTSQSTPDAGAQHTGRQIDYSLTPSHVLRLLLRRSILPSKFNNRGPSPETLCRAPARPMIGVVGCCARSLVSSRPVSLRRSHRLWSSWLPLCSQVLM